MRNLIEFLLSVFYWMLAIMFMLFKMRYLALLFMATALILTYSFLTQFKAQNSGGKP